MKTLGRREIRRISAKPSGELLTQGALFNDALHQLLPTGQTTGMRKGIRRFSTHEEMNQHQDECMIKVMVHHARR